MNINALWARQFCETVEEIYRLYECFKSADEPNFEQYDRAKQLYEDCCTIYGFTKLNFMDFLEIGKSLRGRQAIKKFTKDFDNE